MLNERGSAIVDSVFAIALILVLALGVIQVALALYARNLVLSSAHDAARVAIEIGGSLEIARAAASESVERAVGGIVDDLEIHADRATIARRAVVRVRVQATLAPLGPVPFAIPVDVMATSSKELRPR